MHHAVAAYERHETRERFSVSDQLHKWEQWRWQTNKVVDNEPPFEWVKECSTASGDGPMGWVVLL